MLYILFTDAWPWNCLNLRYSNVSLDEAIRNRSSDVYNAACKGYIGYVQYYVEKKGIKMDLPNESGETPLHLAAANGHSIVIEYIVTRIGAQYLNTYNYKLSTPLMYAAYYGRLNITKYFLDKLKIDSSYSESEKRDVLKMAVRGGNLSVLKYLVEERNYTINETDEDLLVSSGLGGNVDLIKYLIFEKNLTKVGADARSEDTALHKASSEGHLRVVQFLIETLHYEVDVQNVDDETPSYFASEAGSLPVLKYLIENEEADLYTRNVYGDTLLHIAAHRGRLSVIKYLVNQKHMNIELEDYTRRTPIHRAVRENKLNVVKYLADRKNANLKSTDYLGRNLLHQAVYSGNEVMVKYLVDDKKMNTMIDYVDKLNRTAACEAAYYGHLSILKFLLGERNASASIVDADGKNLLHTAARENKLSVVKYLIEEIGFRVYNVTSSGRNAFDFATEYEYEKNDTLEYLKKRWTKNGIFPSYRFEPRIIDRW